MACVWAYVLCVHWRSVVLGYVFLSRTHYPDHVLSVTHVIILILSIQLTPIIVSIHRYHHRRPLDSARDIPIHLTVFDRLVPAVENLAHCTRKSLASLCLLPTVT